MDSIVIWSRPEGVLHVVQEAVNSGDLRGGCGYLPPFTPDEWDAFEEHFDTRKIELGT
ncbi:hypothetical protein [Actinacidiphila oryziradicis]|uniref:hypothetical protein n=1 Tax=Actinacidiphila oryziradicis TaxID=2571141 RepID=UPI00145D7FC0|nr:hypothetical protein [Actinacidiphila oryziradicis]